MADRKMSEVEYDNGDKHILAFEIGRRYSIRNKLGKSLSIFMKPEEAIDLMRKRQGAQLAEGDELVECYVSTQWGSLNIYNCKKVKWEMEDKIEEKKRE